MSGETRGGCVELDRRREVRYVHGCVMLLDLNLRRRG